MARPLPIAIASAFLFSSSLCLARIVMLRGGIMMQPGQIAQQVEAIARTVDDNAPNALALRDAAEENLLALGEPALSALNTSADGHTGFARDALRVAAFRLQNDLNPQDLITAWLQKKTDKQTTPKVGHIISDDLLRQFPHHLIYGIAGARTVLAIAADGKVQDLSDDAALAKFLTNELPEEKGTIARSHAAVAALSLAMARLNRVIKTEDITKDITETTATATLTQGDSAAHADLAFANDGTITTLKTTLELPPPTTTASPIPATTTAPD